MPTQVEAPRPRLVWASRSRGQPAAVAAVAAAAGSLARPERAAFQAQVQPNASKPGEGAPKSSRRHVGFSLGFPLGLSSSIGLRRRGPLRGAWGGGPSAGCMKRRFGGERLLSTVAATIAIISAGAVAIAAETVA